MNIGSDDEGVAAFDSPDVVAAVRTAFVRYERALADGDLAVLTDLFWEDERCTRFGVADRQRGSAQIAAWRREHPRVPPGRALHDTHVLGTGPGTAVVTTLFNYPTVDHPTGRIEGRQTQVWVHTARGWRIVSAHVSEMPASVQTDTTTARSGSAATPPVLLAVAAGYRTGQPLHPELAALGAVRVGSVLTAPVYRLLAIGHRDVPRGGLVRVGHGGVRLEVELHQVPSDTIGELLRTLPAPQVLGPVALDDGRTVPGFLLEAGTVGQDVTQHRSWPAYLRSLSDGSTSVRSRRRSARAQ